VVAAHPFGRFGIRPPRDAPKKLGPLRRQEFGHKFILYIRQGK
jgi:hypothetical protein